MTAPTFMGGRLQNSSPERKKEAGANGGKARRVWNERPANEKILPRKGEDRNNSETDGESAAL